MQSYGGFLQQSDVLDRFAELIRNYDTWRWAELGEAGDLCAKAKLKPELSFTENYEIQPTNL